jgi:hypothetical protein
MSAATVVGVIGNYTIERRKMGTRKISVVLFAVMLFLANDAACQPDAATKKAAEILKDIQKIGGRQSLGVNNSRVLVGTPAIDKIVAAGPEMLDTLVQVMKDEKISFDAFTRCYSACDQIFAKFDPEIRVRWYGGCETKRTEEGTRIFPGGQMDLAKFRREIVKDIVEKAAALKNKK